MFSFSDILFLLVLFLLLFISIFLFTSDKGKRISNILIGGFFLTVCLNLADSFLLLKQFYFQHPSWAGWGSTLLLVCGPFIFLYTQSVLYKDFQFTGKKLVHFLPFILFFLMTEIGYLASSNEEKLVILNGILKRNIPNYVYLFSSLIYIHFFIYIFFSLRSIKQYEVAAANRFSERKKVTLNWLEITAWFFLALVLLSAVNTYLSFLSLQQVYFILFSTIIFLLFLFIIFVLFRALRNPDIFSVLEEREIEAAVQPVKYAYSTIQNHEKKLVLEQLQNHMRSVKPYLEPELTLDDLASQLSVKSKALSQVINELLGQNFFEFINHYRIEEAKQLLTNPRDKKITVLEVMYEVGFNSKSSFNTLFKKQTGLTPSEFKKKHLE
jgi:AraC-like DNA-binding protein